MMHKASSSSMGGKMNNDSKINNLNNPISTILLLSAAKVVLAANWDLVVYLRDLSILTTDFQSKLLSIF